MQSSNLIFQRYKSVDKDAFRELLIAAKGNRTISQFASECGVSVSTLTRILKGENKGSSSPGLLISIANNATPDSNVSLTKLARANGYIIADKTDPPAFRYQDSDVDKGIGERLVSVLERRGILVHEMKQKYSYRVRDKVTKYHSIALKVQQQHREQLWAVDIVSSLPWMTGSGSHIFHLLSEMFMIALTTPEENRPQKYFIVLDSMLIFDQETERFGSFEMPIDTHMLVLSPFSSGVLKEFVLPRLGGWKSEAIFPHP